MKLSRPLILLALAAVLPLTVLAAVLGGSGLRQEQQAMQATAEAHVALASALIEQDLDRHIAILTAASQAVLFDGPLDPVAAKSYLGRLSRSQPQWRAVVITDPEGRRLAAYPGAPIGYPERVVETDSHRAAVATARPVVGRVMRRPSGVLLFAIRAPVIRRGKVAYVISAMIEPEELRRLFFAAPLPPEWRGGVVDASGRVVVRINAPQEALGGFAAPDALRMREGVTRGFAKAMSLEGEPMINAFQVLPRFHWSVHAAMPLRVYQAPLVRSLWLAGTAAVAALLLAGLFLWLLSRELGLRQRAADAFEEGRRMEALGRMTGGVAHDFNNLLTIVQGSAEMLKRRRADPERAGVFVDAILSAAQRGQTLTRQLLAFARRSAQEPADFRLQDRAATLAELIRQSVGEQVLLTLTIPPDTWPLHADPDALEIALINLAVNARDAMPDGGMLSIVAANRTCRRERGSSVGLEGDFVSIAVSDTGGGVPEEHIRHIFEPFYTTKPSGRGTGLGLSQVYGFARQSGGLISVANRAGEGAVFTLYLPRALQEPVAASPAPVVAAAQEPGRLLLVEDDADVAHALMAMLESGGYHVTWAPDGPTALARIESDAPFDVVLSDMLTDRSGRELAAALRRARPDLAVVLMTGHLDGAGEAWGEAVLMKPFGPDRVFDALAMARARASSSNQSLSA
ncbi:MAG TPA: ATP-binding protein [Caulobacteraceae bacterium]|nr:ATP-binding protein [Caulobacteraceae bacterium]